MMLPAMFFELMEKNIPILDYLPASMRIMSVLNFDNSRTGYYNGEDIVRYIITPDAIQWSVDSVGALFIAAIVLIIAYRRFSKKDI